MDLTPERRKTIDDKNHYDLLYKWRYAPAGDKWFQGETGKYWMERMEEKRAESPGTAVANSKAMGW